MTDREIDAEIRLLKRRIEDLTGRIERLKAPSEDTPGILFGSTFNNGTYPTEAHSYFSIQVQRIYGTPGVGGQLASTVTPSIILAWNAGRKVPPIGTPTEVRRVISAWVFKYG